MSVAASPPNRHRPETKREADLRLELAQLQRDALAHCRFSEPRLVMLYQASLELGPAAEQLVAGALHSLRRLREQAR